jgi:mRNA-degrading endonuclease RelE of RelBE toxin-antitoxin system
MNLVVKQTNTFKKSVKKLSKQQKEELDEAVKDILSNPLIGIQKRGDLFFLSVYKFKMNKQLTLLGYNYENKKLVLTLLQVGSHENFYRDINREF